MEPVEKKIHQLFIANGWTLAFAESCTGGAIVTRFVQLPDSSLYLLGSVVAYANSAKINLLKVQEATLKKWGAVSEQTAQEMAQGAMEQFGSDHALSVTGIAGPKGASLQKPVGTLYFTIASKYDTLLSWRVNFRGNRKQIIDQAVIEALEKLWNYTAMPF